MITINMEKAKRRLFFLLFSMNVGGVEKSFLSLLDTLSQHEYEVHVGLLQRRGGFIGMLPSWVPFFCRKEKKYGRRRWV